MADENKAGGIKAGKIKIGKIRTGENKASGIRVDKSIRVLFDFIYPSPTNCAILSVTRCGDTPPAAFSPFADMLQKTAVGGISCLLTRYRKLPAAAFLTR